MKYAIKKSSKNAFYFYFAFFPIVFFVFSFFHIVTQDIKFLLIGFSIVYSLTVVYSIIFIGFFSLYSVYLYTSAFFIYDCFFINLIDTKSNFLIQTWPIKYSISNEAGVIFIICCYLTLYITHISYICSKSLVKKSKIIEKSNLIDFRVHNSSWEKLGISMILISIVPVLAKIYIQVRYVMENGFFVLYTTGLDGIKYPIWTAGAFLIFYGGYYIFLASNPSLKKYLIFTLLYFIVNLAEALKGQRGAIICVIIVCVYYYQEAYQKKIKLKMILLIFLIICFITISMGAIRKSYGGNKVKNNMEKSSQIINTMLMEQTTSRAVPLLIIDKDIKYRRFPFIFFPISNLILPKIYNEPIDSMNGLKKYNNPSQVLMANINVSLALEGRGYGSGFLAEAYDLGKFFGVICLSVLIGYILLLFDYAHLNFKNFYIPIMYSILITIPLIPRAEFFRFLKSWKYFVFAYFMLYLLKLLKQLINRNKLEND